ncbi:YicC/YloC family endoribonuclease [Phaeobacter italicus]|uniref:YicC/YloC family endoribonuclease n=1 Tax=Phaeobacter italicus TaxID=481446 RepID=UPI001C939151|nr:YicC/YloC family endoribonuclease [Phaeobacter italicus]MBY6042639.1 YicC family protein [Phaeobacter italicus]
MTIHSMTGFAAAQGTTGAHSWSCELRSVNAKGLDLRLRIPEWLEGFEPYVRGELGKALARGNVSMTLRINRNEDAGADLTINEAMLATVLSAMAKIEAAAKVAGVDLAPSTSAEILSQRGVLEQGNTADDPAPIVAVLKGAFAAILSDFVNMRASEGAALKAVLLDQLDEIDTLQSRAADLAEARKPQMAETLRTNLARVLDNADKVDEARVAQELALLAVKADVTEEIDRLKAHVSAARDLLAKGGAVGRKLDFLMQEFNREANTLCSKAQNSDLTAIGLDLKSVIDQMREQVQNIE